jgi:hypothetical protein
MPTQEPLWPQPPLPEDASYQDHVNHVKWKDAKSYENIAPHQYILRGGHPESYAVMLEVVKREGIREKFTLRGKSYYYKYYYPGDGYRYWFMWPQGGPTDVLNRCRVEPDPERPGQFRPVGVSG